MNQYLQNIGVGLTKKLIDFGVAKITSPRKASPQERIEQINKTLETLESAPTIGAPESQNQPTSASNTMLSSSSTGVLTREGLDLGTLAYQEQKAYNELWLAETHAKEDCLGCGTDVDCCFKHGMNLVAIAQETKSMTTDPVWQEIEDLGYELQTKAHPDRVREGTHHREYQELAIKISKPRREIQKRIMARRKPEIGLEEAKKIAAEKAVKEIESRWQQVKR